MGSVKRRHRQILPLFCSAAALLCIGDANARMIANWTDAKLSAHADLVVVAKLVSTRDAGKEIADKMPFDEFYRPILSTLDIVYVLKGEHADKRLVVVHNRELTAAEHRAMKQFRMLLNGAILMTFDAKETYVVFLKRRSDGRYEPVTGYDAGLSLKRVGAGVLLNWHEPQRNPSPETAATADGLNNLWSDLAATNAITVYWAIDTLRASPQKAVGLFRQHLRPVPHANAQRLAELLRDLDSAKFTVRDRAAREMEALGETAEPELRQALSHPPSEEVRQRARRLLSRLEGTERWRRSRALEVLESIDDPESRRLLTTLAQGAPHARLTTQAQAALDRLGQRPSR
jgi:hypothetical protein